MSEKNYSNPEEFLIINEIAKAMGPSAMQYIQDEVQYYIEMGLKFDVVQEIKKQLLTKYSEEVMNILVNDATDKIIDNILINNAK